jgi:caa(3)-type oxidase subunit IV
MTENTPVTETPTSERMGVGARVILTLAALTAVEYVIAVAKPPGQIGIIFLIALSKAVLIVIYFMHVRQIWRGDHA